MYLIWSIEHQGWWREDERGYTQDLDEAGLYHKEVAARIVKEANIVSFNECVIPLFCVQGARI